MQSAMSEAFKSFPGQAMYPCVVKPRIRYKGKPNERWEWSIGLDGEHGDAEAQEFARFLNAKFYELNPGLTPGKAGLPYYEIKDDLQRSTGWWRFQFSRRAVRGNGSPNTPPFVQYLGNDGPEPWPEGLSIGNGSIVQIAFTIWRWNPNGDGGAGIGLELEGLIVHKHVAYEEPPPPDYSNIFRTQGPGFASQAAPVAAPPVRGPARPPVRPAPQPVGAIAAGIAPPAAQAWMGQAAPARRQAERVYSDEIPPGQAAPARSQAEPVYAGTIASGRPAAPPPGWNRPVVGAPQGGVDTADWQQEEENIYGLDHL